jgi:hypothetical protein
MPAMDLRRRVAVTAVPLVAVGAAGVLALVLRRDGAPGRCDVAVTLTRIHDFGDGAVAVFRIDNRGDGTCALREVPEVAFTHEGKPVVVHVTERPSPEGPSRVRPGGRAEFQMRWVKREEAGTCPDQTIVDSVAVRVVDGLPPVTMYTAEEGSRGSKIAAFCGRAVSVSDVRAAQG